MDRQKNAPPEARNVVNFLRNKAGMKTRPGIVNGQRADYFKGSAAIKAVLSPEYAKLKNVPAVASEEEAERMLHGLLPYAFYLKVERGAVPAAKDKDQAARRPLQVVQMQMFDREGYFVWLFEGSQLLQKLAGLGLIAVLLAAVMFPLWPMFLRRGVYYLSLGVLGLFGLLMVIAVIRLIFWVITIVVAPPGIWIFPNLFADVGVVESFIPLWAWDVPPPKKKLKRTKKKGKKAVVDGDAPQPDETADADVETATATSTAVDPAVTTKAANAEDAAPAADAEVAASAAYDDIN
ncbi:Translocation protein S62 [Malassezia pachydermatis]